jgi:hypothetical protein
MPNRVGGGGGGVTGNGDATESCRCPLMQGNRAEGARMRPVKRTNFDLQLLFKLTDDSVTSIPFVSNLFHFK